MFRNSWRLRELWMKHSRPIGGVRMMVFHEFEDAIDEFVRSVEQPDPYEKDAEEASKE